MTLRDALLGGPGLDGYVYAADVYCVDCGHDQIRSIFEERGGEIDEDDARDSDTLPQPIFFGESDTAQHCGTCGEYLYGSEAEADPDPCADLDEIDACPEDGCAREDCKACEDKPIKGA